MAPDEKDQGGEDLASLLVEAELEEDENRPELSGQLVGDPSIGSETDGDAPREPSPTPTYPERFLPLDLVLASKDDYMKARCEPDEFENARIVLDDERGVRAMAEELARDGQIHPIGVIERKGFRQHERTTFYGLRSGFRRTRAARSIGWKEIRAVLLPSDMSLIDQHFFHIAENSWRKDLSTYELAARGAYLIEKFQITPRLYAQRVGKSYPYITNLLRCYRELPEEIMDDWKGGHRLLVKHLMERYIVMTPEEAVEHWRIYQGLTPARTKIGPTPPNMTGVKVPHRRASERNLLRLRLVLQQRKNKMPPSTWKLAVQIVDFALGAQRRIPGFPLKVTDGFRELVGRMSKEVVETKAQIAREHAKRTKKHDAYREKKNARTTESKGQGT